MTFAIDCDEKLIEGCPRKLSNSTTGCYYFGVVDCLNKYIPRERVNRVAGASAGSLIAAYYLMDLPLESCLREIIELTEDVRRRPLGVFDRSNQIVDVLPRVLNRLFPEDAHKQVSGRLHVVMTRYKDMKKIIVNEFESKKDLIDALNCSCFIPVWSGNHIATYKGVKHIDGGFSDNLPVFDENTIRICCFSGNTDISPYDKSRKDLLSGTVLNTPLYFTFANFKRGRRALFPPPASYILNLLECGFHDTKIFILDNDLIQCDNCWIKSDKALHSHTISPCISPALSRANSSLNLNELHLNDGPKDKYKNQQFLGQELLYSSPGSQLSFNHLLKQKLKSFTDSSEHIQDLNNNNVAPSIVVEDADSMLNKSDDESNSISPSSSPSSSFKQKQSPPGEKEPSKPRANSDRELSQQQLAARKALQNRRSTLASLNTNELAADKFKRAPDLLPSCPPSPNLNRHCMECARLRIEARNDGVEATIKLEAEKYTSSAPPIKDNLRTRLTSPLRWIKQIGVKNSYKFEAAQLGRAHSTKGREIPAL